MNAFKQSGYNLPEGIDDFEGIARTFVNEAASHDIAVEPKPEKAKHMIKNDLRDAIPPQLFALIAKITAAIESTSENPANHLAKDARQGQNSHSSIDKNKV